MSWFSLKNFFMTVMYITWKWPYFFSGMICDIWSEVSGWHCDVTMVDCNFDHLSCSQKRFWLVSKPNFPIPFLYSFLVSSCEGWASLAACSRLSPKRKVNRLYYCYYYYFYLNWLSLLSLMLIIIISFIVILFSMIYYSI